VVVVAVGIVWPIVGLLGEPRLDTVPASATPAISRTPPMIAAILYMPSSFARCRPPRFAAGRFAAGKGGEERGRLG
jgi:hypothetical protein